MRLSPLLILLATLGLVLAARPSGAQCPDLIQRELDLTDLTIERADRIVAGADNQAARLALDEAHRLQAQARSELLADHCRIALEVTRLARARATRAIAIVSGLPDPDRVRRQLERTREVLEGARDRIEECNDDRARSMLRAGFQMQARAEAAFEAERFLAALQLSLSARERGFRALRLCNVEENVRASAERALARTDEIISQARDQLAEKGSEPARRTLARALELQERAQGEYRAEHFEATLRLTQSARALAYRSLRLSRGAS